MSAGSGWAGRLGLALGGDDEAFVVPGQSVPSGRRVEAWLLVFAWGLGVGAYIVTYINRGVSLPANWYVGPALWGLMVLAVHLIVRWRARYADPVILPVVVALSGLGLAMQSRLDLATNQHQASGQLIGMAIGMLACAAVVVWLRDYRVLQRFPYLLFVTGLLLLLMPLLPVVGRSSGGSRIWIYLFGQSFQPAEVAKIVLALAFASYLADRSETLQVAGKRIGPIKLPRLRDVMPILIMWGASVLVLVFQNDFGTALLFFGLFIMMIYLATAQWGWVAAGFLSFAGAAFVVFRYAPHVQVRVNAWLHPFDNINQNYQVVEGQFGIAWGGLFGRGWGLGLPTRVPVVRSDFILAAFGEELGLLGMMAIVLMYAIWVTRGFKASLMAREAFGKLLTAGLSFAIVLQVTAIVGGVTRLLPLTGLTTPFLSQGKSSLLANWVIVALLLVVSHQGRRPIEAFEPFVDLEAEQTAAIDISQLLEGGVGPRVVVAAPEAQEETS